MTNIVETVVTAPVQLSPDAIEILNLIGTPSFYYMLIFIVILIAIK